MGTDTTVTVNGEPVPGDGLVQAVADAPPPETYLVVGADDVPVSAVMWDGVADYQPGDGLRLVLAADWTGAELQPRPEAQDVKARRTRVERLSSLVGQLADDLTTFDTLTAAQRQAAQRRALRATLLLVREVLQDQSTDE
jgi:hypothetical protein